MKDADRLNLKKSLAIFEESKKLIPGGTLGIRRPYNFVEGEYPIFFDHGKGARVVEEDGTTDATKILLSKGGVPATTLMVPIRNLHSTVGIADMKDVDETIDEGETDRITGPETQHEDSA